LKGVISNKDQDKEAFNKIKDAFSEVLKTQENIKPKDEDDGA